MPEIVHVSPLRPMRPPRCSSSVPSGLNVNVQIGIVGIAHALHDCPQSEVAVSPATVKWNVQAPSDTMSEPPPAAWMISVPVDADAEMLSGQLTPEPPLTN